MSQDSKYFGNNKRGEIHELQEDLAHPKEDKRKEGLKKVIAAMTVGKDVSMLFTEVLNCVQTNNIELKKLVYLYVINHAKIQPDRAILAVNTFQKDATDPNPIIRALAIRTMGCIRLNKVTEYLCEPLRNCLKDRDPYVRKTAALCVAKLYDISPEMVDTQGFIDTLLQLLGDSNPAVVANAIAALSEIDELSSKPIFTISSSNLTKLQAALNECTEWGQVYILNALCKYTPQDAKEAETICDRISPRLNHANSAVVLATIKVLMLYLDQIKNPEAVKNLYKKMAPPLVTLLTTKEPEMQYVALRNINLVVQKKPNLLAHEMRVFFIKYNDPIYVKMEKLDIMIMLATDKNIEQLLNEFKEAASEVDVEFVRKAVRAIGRCAIKLEKAAEKCIEVLLQLIQTKVNYVVQEAIIVIRDIFRRYPSQYESIIATLCENLDTLDEPEAKAAMIWIIGEYAERIENASELLDSFLDTFQEEGAQVQLQLLTSVVKLFLKRPKDTQEMVQKLLNMATQETDNPDLRDRGYVYWRLLSTDPEAAKTIVLGDRPLISDNTTQLDENLLNDLLGQIASLSSIYHKPPQTFISKTQAPRKEKKKKAVDNDESLLPKNEGSENILDMEGLGQALPNPQKSGSLLDQLDFFNAPAREVVTKELVLPADRGYGLQIAAAFVRKDGQLYLDLNMTNYSQVAISGLAIQFNRNSFGLLPAQPQVGVILPGQAAECSLLLAIHPNQISPPPLTPLVQIAMKAMIGTEKVVYFQLAVPLHTLFLESGQIGREEYLGLWKSITEENFKDIINTGTLTPDIVKRKMELKRVFYIAQRTVQQQEFLYFSAKVKDNIIMLVEISLGASCRMCVKTQSPEYVALFQQAIESILTS